MIKKIIFITVFAFILMGCESRCILDWKDKQDSATIISKKALLNDNIEYCVRDLDGYKFCFGVSEDTLNIGDKVQLTKRE